MPQCRNLLFVLFLFTLSLSSVASASEHLLVPENFLTVGNQWQYTFQVTYHKYRDVNGVLQGGAVNYNGTATMNITGTQTVSGYATHVVEMNRNIPGVMDVTETMNWYRDSDHLVEVRWQDAEGYEQVRSAYPAGNPWEIMPVSISDTAVNQVFGYGEYAGQMTVSPFYNWTGSVTSAITYQGQVAITVPAGPFTCTKVYIRSDWTDDSGWHGYDENWFYMRPDVGIVRMETHSVEYMDTGALDSESRTIMELSTSNFQPPEYHRLIPDDFLAKGNVWHYDMHISRLNGAAVSHDGTVTMTIGGQKVVRGYDTREMTSHTNIPDLGEEIETGYAYLTEDYLVEVRCEDGDSWEQVRSDFPDGDPWELLPVEVSSAADQLLFGYGEYEGAQTVSPYLTWDGSETHKITFLGTQSLTVPAGTFDCVKVLQRMDWIDLSGWNGYVEEVMWLNASVGMIRKDTHEKDFDNNGTMTEEIQSSMSLTTCGNRMGDADDDGDVDLADAVACCQALARVAADARVTTFSDVDADGRIGMGDTAFVLQRLAGRR